MTNALEMGLWDCRCGNCHQPAHSAGDTCQECGVTWTSCVPWRKPNAANFLPEDLEVIASINARLRANINEGGDA